MDQYLYGTNLPYVKCYTYSYNLNISGGNKIIKDKKLDIWIGYHKDNDKNLNPDHNNMLDKNEKF